MSIKKIILILIGFVITIGLISYLLFTSIFYDSFESRTFNSEEWKKEKYNRVELVDDLIESKILDSLVQMELLNLLGKPEKEPTYFKENGRNLVYHLGPERGLGIDSEWLLI
ncbi:hypothetical protein [Seonamhaeicola sp.]|uniref:hypothetical protein n=1 Tax=Seonamhaeicola sp. TaxID=1912245 RepID=UPI00263145A1|nr:hypothetical protein [Seonamhaeicola sp.]